MGTGMKRLDEKNALVEEEINLKVDRIYMMGLSRKFAGTPLLSIFS